MLKIEDEQEIDIQNIEETGIMKGWALLVENKKIDEQIESINFTLNLFGETLNEITNKQNTILKYLKNKE